ncbi:condensation domain-containing protein [Cupriavidus necator]|uniref:condensation domain-containing protein n=1 Tax=Cupriavidus necator TaxID=106590 RepID=UPI00339D5890
MPLEARVQDVPVIYVDIVSAMASFLKEKAGMVDVDIDRSVRENGGDSLAATLLAAHLRSGFQVDCSAAKLLGEQSLVQVSRNLEQGVGGTIAPTAKSDAYPLSDQQTGVAFDQIRTPLGKQYNLPLYVETGPQFEIRRFSRCIIAVLKRHAGLHMRLVLRDGNLQQQIAAFDETELDIVDRGVTDDLQEELVRFCQPFDLEHGPLYRFAKVSCAGKHYLLFDMHHIVTDGYSKKLLFAQIDALYSGRYPALPDLTYTDYCCWVQAPKLEAERASSLAYWKAKIFPLPQPLALPVDRAWPPVRLVDAGCVSAFVGAEDVARLSEVAQHGGATLYEALIASYGIAVSCITGNRDFILGSPVLGRTLAGTENVIGMFASTACYRLDIDMRDSFSRHLAKVADEVRATTQQSFFPLNEMVEMAAQERPDRMSRHPIFDLMLAFHARQLVEVQLDSRPVIWEPAATRCAIFDLHMHIFERPTGLDIRLIFNSSLFSGQTASDWLSAYMEVISALSRVPGNSMESVL